MLIFSLQLVHDLFNKRIAAVARDSGLSPSQFRVMQELAVPGASQQTMDALSGRLLTTSGNIDLIIRNLVGKGLVSKRPNPGDKRQRIVSLTPKGRQFADAHAREGRRVIQRSLRRLSIAEKEVFAQMLATIHRTPEEEDDAADRTDAIIRSMLRVHSSESRPSSRPRKRRRSYGPRKGRRRPNGEGDFERYI